MSSLNGPSALQKLVNKRWLAMINMSDNGKILIQQNYTNGTIKKYLKLRNGKIYLFQTYSENNAWLHYLILLVVLLQEIQLWPFFVHKIDCQSLNGVIDLSTYQPIYNIKIIFMCTIFLHEQPKSNTTYNHKISTKSIHCDAALS